MTGGLLISRATKNTLHKLSMTQPTHFNIQNFKIYRNIYNSLIKKSKILYFQTELTNSIKNPKKTWEIYNEITARKTPSTKINEIEIDGTISHNPTNIANHFNSFFSEIGQKIAGNIEQSSIDPLSFSSPPPNTYELLFDKISPIHVADLIKSMPNKTSCDIDGLSCVLLKSVAAEICTPLAHIFNLSLTNGQYPEKFKTSRVVPIYKNGDKLSCDNYRPISLVSSIAKILDKIVAIKLTNHLDLNKLIYPYQFGFQKKVSTEDSLLHLQNFVSTALNEDKYCIGIFLDLKKAFDVVSHDILIKKLEKIGIKNNCLKWFKCYLSGRKQMVDINGTYSSPAEINISVLQGSILGPLLFLCFINDLPNSTKLFLLLFADDTCALSSNKNLPDLINFCNVELQKIANWLTANKLAVNVSKCKYILFHNPNKRIDANLCLNFNFNEMGGVEDPNKIWKMNRVYTKNTNVEDRVYKYLGVLIDENFNLNIHFDNICKKLSKGLFCLRRAKNIINTIGLRAIYFSIFHSHLLYCSLILNCASSTQINRVLTLQKKAIRIVSNANYNAHCAPLFNNLDILPFDKILTFRKACFMHNLIYGHPHSSFNHFLVTNNDRNVQYNLRNNNQLTLTAPRFERFKKFPIYDFAHTWNNLGDVKLQSNYSIFKSWLKHDLIVNT